MSVHKELAQHAEKMNGIYKTYLQLDQQREVYIEEAVQLCKQGLPFTTSKINEVTNQINTLNLRFIPFKKNVTPEMVQEYVEKIKNKDA
ncbi:DUF2533 family protein [Bacillus sp. FJAT-27251]|uniref:DUF2533 family protein n=1 Tax=Bacillus sp. FJAT-27251 TaxID=1684142 RepID=UPI0006A77160|nr:DUF2533 family protein [Bacillus sp. FJAT-27251]